MKKDIPVLYEQNGEKKQQPINSIVPAGMVVERKAFCKERTKLS